MSEYFQEQIRNLYQCLTDAGMSNTCSCSLYRTTGVCTARFLLPTIQFI